MKLYDCMRDVQFPLSITLLSSPLLLVSYSLGPLVPCQVGTKFVVVKIVRPRSVNVHGCVYYWTYKIFQGRGHCQIFF